VEEESLTGLRERMRTLDLELVALAAERVALASRVGDIKTPAGNERNGERREATACASTLQMAPRGIV